MLLFRALASGSSGNAFLLRTDNVTLLFEAGIRLSALQKSLLAEDVHPTSISAVIISHEHRDHCMAARDLASEHGIQIRANEKVLRAAGLVDLPEAAILDVGDPCLFGDVEVTPFPVSHDSVCPVGFNVRAGPRTIVIATDLGTPTPELTEAVEQADLVVLEANHDTEMLLRGRYPYHLRRRISGPTGHLSNQQAASILTSHVKGEDVDVWLAHLSKENNTATVATRTVRNSLKAVGLGALALGVAQRDRPSLRWTGVPRPRQLSLFAGEMA